MTQKTKTYHFLHLICITSCLYMMGLTNTFANPLGNLGPVSAPNYPTPPTTCLDAIQHAITTEMSDSNIDVTNPNINDTVTDQMTEIFTDVMSANPLCEQHTTKASLHNKTFELNKDNHKFKFTIKITSAVTPGASSKYYLLFDNGNYDEQYKNITEPTDFTQANPYKFWKDDCSQEAKNPHTSRILDNRDLNKTLKEIRKILGTTARTEYVLNQPHDSKTGEVYQINGLLLIAPNAQQDQRVVWNTTDKTKAYTVQEKIRDAFNQGSRTSCNDLRIYVLEHQINNSTQEHKYIVHPTPVTISR